MRARFFYHAAGALLLGGAFVGAASACADVLGVERDRFLVTASAGASGGGMAGTAGTAGAAGQAGAAGNAGSAGGMLDPKWCLGTPPPGPSVRPVEFDVFFFDGFGAASPTTLDGPPVPGVSVRGCYRLDPMCTAPATPEIVTGADGFGKLTVPADFQGYLEIRKEGFMPGIYYHYRMHRGGPALRAALLNEELLPVVVTSAGLPFVATEGHMLKNAFDCDENNTNEASFTIEGDLGDQTRPWFLVGGFPSGSATATDEGGVGGYVNLPTGSYKTETRMRGVLIGSLSVHVRAGWFTYVVEGPG
jgi:hypothetical protein